MKEDLKRIEAEALREIASLPNSREAIEAGYQ